MNGLSICIPVYNFNCISTVKALCNQMEFLNINTELIVVDDASKVELADLSNFKHPNYSYEKLINNFGRSKIRNYLADKAMYSHILYLDGDSGVKDHFLDTYLKQIHETPKSVICGGRHHDSKPLTGQMLRYNYGLKFEETTPEKRRIDPYKSFMTNNFITPRKTIRSISFNESISRYGQEDTFFGYELNKHKIDIIHIDNPIIHLDIDTNAEYIEKTKNSIKNLMILKNEYPEFMQYSKLLGVIEKRRIFQSSFIKNSSTSIANFLERITIKNSNTYSFQLFKLFYAISLNK